MDIQKVLAEYDGMFGKASLSQIEEFLFQKLQEAASLGEDEALFTLLNEMIGFCRDTMQREKGLKYCDVLQGLLVRMNLQGRVEWATALLNIANAYRAFGLLQESLGLYEQVHENYQKNVGAGDFSFASLYNNWSLLYQEMEEYEKAVAVLRRALEIADAHREAKIPQATSRVNLAVSLLHCDLPEALTEAKSLVGEALDIFEADGGRDFHYNAALVAMGDVCVAEHGYEDAAGYYHRGLQELEKHVGRNDNYFRVQEKYRYALQKAGKESAFVPNLERCRRFYETYGKQMILEHFPEYESRIAVGLVGEGSDCFGFDDEISTDHDYEVGFCMWLTREDYDEIGEALQVEYRKLTDALVQGSMQNTFLGERRGVFEIEDFYKRLLGDGEEYQYAQAVNGAVFRDDLGAFTAIRERLAGYYPEKVWREKLAGALHDFSQYGQSNYARMMARKDYVTAKLCVSKAMESAMDIVYLLNRTYAPYYKWKKKGLERLQILPEVASLLEELALLHCQKAVWVGYTYHPAHMNEKDECIRIIERIAEEIRTELSRQKLITGEDPFLELYVQRIKEGMSVMEIIDKIVALEWEQFDKVQNKGGRAFCQDDWNTFSIMRKSQYLTWNMELLESYLGDLEQAEEKGWNLIMEKYARMMKSTAPEEYAALEKDLPVRSEERILIQEEIIKIQVAWMEEFAAKYPLMAGNARSIHTSEDNAFNTSYETYLRGELGTYGEETFVLYGRFVAGLLQEGKNLAYETMSNTARLYGYDSVEDAEAKLGK